MVDYTVIGGATGTATYDAVTVEAEEDQVVVLGDYNGDQSGYTAPLDDVYIDGIELHLSEGSFSLIPPEGERVYVTATEDDELHIENGKRRGVGDGE